jgi:hypothetical protein
MTKYEDIPDKVVLQNMTTMPQRLEFGVVVPAGTMNEKGEFVPGEVTIDMLFLKGHRREKVWKSCQNAHAGLALQIKSS